MSKVSAKLRDLATEIDKAESDAPRSAHDIMERHCIKERRIELCVDPYMLGRSNFPVVDIARREAAHKLAADLIESADFKLVRRAHIVPHDDRLCPPPDRFDTYGTSLVAISAEKLITMLQEAFRAGRQA